jgi:acyl dehydratase
MVVLNAPSELAGYVGQTLGTSEWMVIDQTLIDQFAWVTRDNGWYHIDAQRARRELPGGKTIAHGYLLVALLPALGRDIVRLKSDENGNASTERVVNYGCDRIRLITPVQAGDRVRLTTSILEAHRKDDGSTLIKRRCVVEVDGKDKPAMVADTLSMVLQ